MLQCFKRMQGCGHHQSDYDLGEWLGYVPQIPREQALTLSFLLQWLCRQLKSLPALSCSLSVRGSWLCGVASEDPLIRWGLMHPCKDAYQYISCIFSGYHAVRRDIREFGIFFEYKQLVLHSAQLKRARSVFAEVFKVEARELFF